MIPVNNMHNFFDALPADVQAAFDGVSSYRDIAQGDMILRAGEVRKELYQLFEGSAKYCHWDYQGREMVAAVVRRKDWVGISALFTRLPAMSSVVALSSVTLRVVKQRDLERLMDRFPIVARELLRLQSLRFNVMYCLDIDRSVLRLKERLIKTLYALSLGQSQLVEGHHGTPIEMSQEELSKLLIASRQKLNQALKDLEREGLVEVGYGRVCLRNLDDIGKRYAHLLGGSQPVAVYSA